MIEGKNDTIVITETKFDSTFSTSQFWINGFTKLYKT